MLNPDASPYAIFSRSLTFLSPYPLLDLPSVSECCVATFILPEFVNYVFFNLRNLLYLILLFILFPLVTGKGRRPKDGAKPEG